MKITIDEVPLSKNQYVNLHWNKRRLYKKRIFWLIYKETNLNEHTFKKATVTFDIYFKTKRRRDIQNYLGGGLIAWLDVLVENDIIADDCYDCIGQPLVNFYIDKANPRCEIRIERRD